MAASSLRPIGTSPPPFANPLPTTTSVNVQSACATACTLSPSVVAVAAIPVSATAVGAVAAPLTLSATPSTTAVAKPGQVLPPAPCTIPGGAAGAVGVAGAGILQVSPTKDDVAVSGVMLSQPLASLTAAPQSGPGFISAKAEAPSLATVPQHLVDDSAGSRPALPQPIGTVAGDDQTIAGIVARLPPQPTAANVESASLNAMPVVSQHGLMRGRQYMLNRFARRHGSDSVLERGQFGMSAQQICTPADASPKTPAWGGLKPMPTPTCRPSVALHEDETRALRCFEVFHAMPIGSATIDQIRSSAEGLAGWAGMQQKYDDELLARAIQGDRGRGRGRGRGGSCQRALSGGTQPGPGGGRARRVPAGSSSCSRREPFLPRDIIEERAARDDSHDRHEVEMRERIRELEVKLLRSREEIRTNKTNAGCPAEVLERVLSKSGLVTGSAKPRRASAPLGTAHRSASQHRGGRRQQSQHLQRLAGPRAGGRGRLRARIGVCPWGQEETPKGAVLQQLLPNVDQAFPTARAVTSGASGEDRMRLRRAEEAATRSESPQPFPPTVRFAPEIASPCGVPKVISSSRSASPCHSSYSPVAAAKGREKLSAAASFTPPQDRRIMKLTELRPASTLIPTPMPMPEMPSLSKPVLPSVSFDQSAKFDPPFAASSPRAASFSPLASPPEVDARQETPQMDRQLTSQITVATEGMKYRERLRSKDAEIRDLEMRIQAQKTKTEETRRFLSDDLQKFREEVARLRGQLESVPGHSCGPLGDDEHLRQRLTQAQSDCAECKRQIRMLTVTAFTSADEQKMATQQHLDELQATFGRKTDTCNALLADINRVEAETDETNRRRVEYEQQYKALFERNERLKIWTDEKRESAKRAEGHLTDILDSLPEEERKVMHFAMQFLREREQAGGQTIPLPVLPPLGTVTVEGYSHQIDKIRAEKDELASEMRTLEDILRRGREIGEDLEEMHKLDMAETRKHIDANTAQVIKLSKLSANRRRHIHELQDILDRSHKKATMWPVSDHAVGEVGDFSESGFSGLSDLDGGSNAVDLYVTTGRIEQRALHELASRPGEDVPPANSLNTVILVEFMHFDVISTEAATGLHPRYDSLLSFSPLDLNDTMLEHMVKVCVRLELQAFASASLSSHVIGRAELKLSPLFDCSPQAPNPTVVGSLPFASSVDGRLQIATLDYKIRWRKPIFRELNAFTERKGYCLGRPIAPDPSLLLHSVAPELFGASKTLIVRILSIDGLVSLRPGVSADSLRPYVTYQIRGYREHFTQTKNGQSCQIDDTSRNQVRVDADFCRWVEDDGFQFFVFDAATPTSGNAEDMIGLLGEVRVSIRQLLNSPYVHVQGRFPLQRHKPLGVPGAPSQVGTIDLAIRWADEPTSTVAPSGIPNAVVSFDNSPIAVGLPGSLGNALPATLPNSAQTPALRTTGTTAAVTAVFPTDARPESLPTRTAALLGLHSATAVAPAAPPPPATSSQTAGATASTLVAVSMPVPAPLPPKFGIVANLPLASRPPGVCGNSIPQSTPALSVVCGSSSVRPLAPNLPAQSPAPSVVFGSNVIRPPPSGFPAPAIASRAPLQPQAPALSTPPLPPLGTSPTSIPTGVAHGGSMALPQSQPPPMSAMASVLGGPGGIVGQPNAGQPLDGISGPSAANMQVATAKLLGTGPGGLRTAGSPGFS